jgi:uncharacterized protein YndB with AHSA1/START domain
MPSNVTSVEPVRKSVTVPAAPRRAFELFTAHMHQWWPLPTHSVGAEHAVGIVFGAGAGAAIVETMADGTTAVWGTVTRWEPPHRVAFTWHPGAAEAEATRVEVTFTQAGRPAPWCDWSTRAGSAGPTARPHARTTTPAGNQCWAASSRRPRAQGSEKIGLDRGAQGDGGCSVAGLAGHLDVRGAR